MLVGAGLAATAALSSSPAVAAGSEQAGICERHVSRAARKYGIPLGIFYAVGLTESGRKGGLHPFAMNIAGEARFPATVEMAMREFHDARRRGIRLIDMGCMQINHYYHRENFPSDLAMFDPARNVEYAAKFLKELKDKHKTWSMAVARYHAGPDNDPAQKKYVCRVIGNMVAAGIGKWTPESRSFCNRK
ncbi:transglycosylase SLT domain-containing protein [Oricola thermophila]|uniref:Transglycosylase SLT domain-containing protein n=2 Tax=Oricola thermophila TaxID=2742145 RepID=A0A6N1VI99_9HYPH|nr:transglycosylase SLT domain-containing protein [Oricola thermophila]